MPTSSADDLAMRLQIRKTAVFLETPQAAPVPVCRGYAAAVLRNPCLAPGGLADGEAAGAALGELLTNRLLAAMHWVPGTPLAYGKAAIVGVEGSTEHAAAILHPKMGRPLRQLIGQGKAIIPSTAKIGAPGASVSVPLHGADDEWNFALIDSLEASIGDAPLPHEIVVLIALAQGGRLAT